MRTFALAFFAAAAAASIAEDTTKRKRQKIRPKKAIMNGIKGPNDKTARTPSPQKMDTKITKHSLVGLCYMLARRYVFLPPFR